MATLDELREQRLAKLQALQQAGITPYPATAKRTHTNLEAVTLFDTLTKASEPVTLVGRIMSMRGHGKAIFFHLEDFSGQIQAYAKADLLKEQFDTIIKNLDIGDFIQGTGTLFKTQRGEITLRLINLQLIAKTLRPLPEKWHGLKDVEKRYRQRYLDFLVNKDARQKIIIRDTIIRTIRQFLQEKGFIEIQFPVLETEASGALAKPFITHINVYNLDLYLRICMGELWQKRMMVAGFEKVFEIGRAFRNEGVDHQHNPEFTLLEYYWAYADYQANLQFHEEFFPYLVKKVFNTLSITYEHQTLDFTPPYPKKNYRDIFLEKIDLDIEQYNTKEKLFPVLRKKGLEIDEKASWNKLVDHAFKHLILPSITQPTFLLDYPLALSPLAKKKENNPAYVERFQLIINGFEISNSYSELNDPLDQAERFQEQAQLAAAGDEEALRYDQDFIVALEHGMPPTTGTGIGIDRLVALLTGAHSLREVIAFPVMKPTTTLLNEKQNQTPLVAKKTNTNLQPTCTVTHKTALKLVNTHIKDESKPHVFAVETAMKALALYLGEDEHTWSIAGLLHDIDYDIVANNLSEHCGQKTTEILSAIGMDSMLIDQIRSHNEQTGIQRSTKLAKALFAVDGLTGLIAATALVRPSKSIVDMEVRSVLKKFKDRSFAASVQREHIKTCETELGIPLEKFIEITLTALQNQVKKT